MILDVVPDIHGHLGKLDAALDALGYRKGGGLWRAPQEGRSLLFLGDLIDRGPDQRAVVERVADLEDAGLAQRVLGNHEMNALHWVMERDGAPVRPHSDKNRFHHQAFLDAFDSDPQGHRATLDRLAQAHLCIRHGRFVFVHAFWTPALEARARYALGGTTWLDGLDALARNPLFLDAAQPSTGSPEGQAIDLMTKGPETALPDGYALHLEHGIVRHAVRRAWWRHDAPTWRDASISVPHDAVLPDDAPPAIPGAGDVPDDAVVVFGHYWMEDLRQGRPMPLLGGRHVCLDQGAGHGGQAPLAVLTLDTDSAALPQTADGYVDPRALTVVR